MKYSLLSIIIISSFIIGCKKSDSITPEPIVALTRADTLSSGWAKIKLLGGDISDIFFSNSTNGYLGNSNGIYKSIDGGTNWNLVYNRTITNIAVTNNGNAFFINDSIYKTSNAGLTFISQNYRGTDIFFINNIEGFLVTGYGLYKSIDAGVSWQKVITTGLSLQSNGYTTMYFQNNNYGLITSSNNFSYLCNGNITNWTPISFTPVSPSNMNFVSVFFTPNNNAYIINELGELFKSTDGGSTFSLIKSFQNIAGFCDIHFIDNNIGYVSKGNRIYKTTDAGLNWVIAVALGEDSIIEIHFTDATHGWACGFKGLVLKFN
jgi:photosystem II stability/assembly factor-like uncharacterized protein